MNCRHCGHLLEHIFLDLGFAPPSNAYLTEADLHKPESQYPLILYVCDKCWLVQTKDYAKEDELFHSDYAYFSSVSQGWQEHASRYVEQMCSKFQLNEQSYVLEVGSNDGCLLKNFVSAGIPCLGIEPTASTAEVAENLGVTVLREFFSDALALRLASENKKADLIVGNNVYAHVPDINSFTAGLKNLLKPSGVITLEFPHLLKLIEGNQFDTVYHEHFSYLSLQVVIKMFNQAGLRVWDVESLSTHGGSLRIYGCHANDPRKTTAAVKEILMEEQSRGLQEIATYRALQTNADEIKNNLLYYLIKQKRAGKTVAAYGAAAKGNTLLNYAGVKPDLIPYVCDEASSKQGKFMPGSHIPILSSEVLHERRPDIVLILPWNIANEVITQNAYVHDWGGIFVVPIPDLQTISLSSAGPNP